VSLLHLAIVPGQVRVDTDPLMLFAKRHFHELIKLGLLWEASRTFTVLCQIYPIRSYEGADAQFILSMYENITKLINDADIRPRSIANFDLGVSGALTALLAKVSFMLYIVRIYEESVEVLVRFVKAGIPSLRKLYTEAVLLMTVLLRHEGESEDSSICFNVCKACMEYWKWSDSAAETIRKLNIRIEEFNSRLANRGKDKTLESRLSRRLPEITARPVISWLKTPPPIT
jgi:hypothetical protein